MDPYDREASYYEISLTNRQVVTGFVILLACLFAAFLSGVWIGQGGSGSATPGPQIAESAPPPATPGSERLEQLTFFGEKERPASAAPQPPAAAPARPSPAELEAEKLRRTLEEEMAANRAAEADAVVSADEAAPTPAPGTRVRRAPASDAVPAPDPERSAAPPAAPTASAATSPASPPTWIQVYSSNNGSRAREITESLRRSGFEVRTLETDLGGGTTYRVRVGPYAARSDADRAAARLRREFRLDTWVTDQP